MYQVSRTSASPCIEESTAEERASLTAWTTGGRAALPRNNSLQETNK